MIKHNWAGLGGPVPTQSKQQTRRLTSPDTGWKITAEELIERWAIRTRSDGGGDCDIV